VVVDEIQRLPTLLNEVHRFIEERQLRFVLPGSSARKLKRAGSNLLAGRALQRVLMPLLPQELAADEALVRNLPGFARFLPVAALFHGQVLNIAGLARDAGVARTTVVGYLEVLEDAYLAWPLPAYEARLRVKERRHPKLYWTDPGVVRTVRQEFHPPTIAEPGALLEGWVAMLLRAYGDPISGLGGRHDGLFYWSPAGGGTEVDFLVQRGGESVAIEVKAKTRLGTRDFAGLKAIAALPGLTRRLMVFLGERPFRTADGVDALPVPHFLEELEAGRV
jgi:predicted AAA+ superfamily ATPase